MSNRLAIYVQYDPDGVVRDYVKYCLRGLREVVDHILVVVNGPLTDESRAALNDLAGVEVLRRENQGFDFGAWQAGLEHYGYDRLAGLDALLLTNNSYYGPIYPFAEMWSAMDRVDCDFWGVSRHPEVDVNIIKDNPGTRLRAHLQSYWLVFRQNLLQSDAFASYWRKVQTYHSFDEAVGLGEVNLTAHFESLGYRSATYLDSRKYDRLLTRENPGLLADLQIREDRCPIIKRKFFFDSSYQYNLFMIRPEGGLPRQMLNFLGDSGLYDTNIIWDDLLGTQCLSRLSESLDLNYVLPSADVPAADGARSAQVALIVYLDTEQPDPGFRGYVESMPLEARIIVVSPPANAAASMEIFDGLSRRVDHRVQGGPGGARAAWLVTARDVVEASDYVCLVHSEKFRPTYEGGADYGLHDRDLREHCLKSLLYNQAYVAGIIAALDRDKRLGLLFPPIPVGSDYRYALLSDQMEGHRSAEQAFSATLFPSKLKPDPQAVRPFGGMFWARSEALTTMLGRDWSGDWPKNDEVITGCLAAAAQYDGFYPARVMPDIYAGAMIGDMQFWLKSIYRLEDRPLVDMTRLRALKFRLVRYRLLALILRGKLGRRYHRKRTELERKIMFLEALIGIRPE